MLPPNIIAPVPVINNVSERNCFLIVGRNAIKNERKPVLVVVAALSAAFDLDHDIDSKTISNYGTMLFFASLILSSFGKLLGVELLLLLIVLSFAQSSAEHFTRIDVLCVVGCEGEN